MAVQGEAAASEVLREIAASDPDRLALEVGDDRMTYAELDAATASVAAALVDRLGSGRHHVMLQIESTRAVLIASLAVGRAGMVTVPIDPTAPAEHVRRVAADVEATAILTDLAESEAGVEAINPLDLVAEPPTDWADVPPGEYVSIAFTSGSTGEPKGIVMAQRNYASMLTGDLHAAQEFPRAAVIAIGSNNATVLSLETYIGTGATIAAYEIRRDGLTGIPEWLRSMNTFNFGGVPTLVRHIMAALGPNELIGATTFYLSGEASTWEDVAEIRRHLAPNVQIINLYSGTEAGGVLHYVIDVGTELGTGALPLGVPFPGKLVELVDEEGQPVPPGEPGEIVVTSRETSLGYWKRPEETAQTFTELGDGLRRVRTGDLGRLLPDGNIEYRGRADHMVKIAGNRVELGHLEATLRQLDGVADAAATTYVDEAGELRLTASVVPVQGKSLHPSALRVELTRRLPAPLLPDGIAVLDELPRLPGGKVDRLRLPVARRLAGESSAPPETELEERILRRWQEVLGSEGLGVEDDFFTVGGDSLRGARVIIGMNEELAVDLPVSVLVEAPTVRQLAALLETGSAPSPLVTARSEGSGPPLFVVHDVYGEVVHTRLLSTLLPDGFPIYGLLGQALEGRGIPERSIEELAGSYVAAIRTVRPHGPYLLYGASSGGTIGFEMARQLRRAGEDVPVLLLGDSVPPGFGLRERAAARASELREMPAAAAARYALRLAARQLAFRARRSAAFVSGSDRRARARQAADDELMRAATAGGPAVPLALRATFAMRIYGGLLDSYLPDSRYDGPLTVLRCDPSTFPAEPWDRFLTAPAKQVPIGGRHFELATEAGMRKVAAVLIPEIEGLRRTTSRAATPRAATAPA